MKRVKFQELLESAKTREKNIIVGAGLDGAYLALRLKQIGIKPYLFFDNNIKKIGTLVEGVRVCIPERLQGDCYYIISVVEDRNIEVLYAQLRKLGIADKDIVALPDRTNRYKYRTMLSREEYKDELGMIYYEKFGKLMNWENPQTYNEKINWEKVNIMEPKRTQLADKYLVRDYIKEKIGEDYLTCLYGVWDSADEIDFDKLPDNFVLKINNGSGRNIIVPDKNKMNREEVVKQLKEWLSEKYAYYYFELQYKDIEPKIICEEYLAGVAENLYDYDVYCFHGEPKYVWCINGSHRENCKASFYDLNWNKQPFSYGYPYDETVAPRPDTLDKMIELSRILAKDYEHVRIDWYQFPSSKNGILFSEITFSTWSGLNHFRPIEYDLIFGKMI